MSEAITMRTASAGRAEMREQAVGSIHLDGAMVGLSAWFVVGLFIDGWSHTHGRVDQSFFTPWHANFYSGFLAVASFLVFGLISNHVQGFPWRRSLGVVNSSVAGRYHIGRGYRLVAQLFIGATVTAH